MCELTPRLAIIDGLRDYLKLFAGWPDGDLRRHLRNGFPWIIRDWFPDAWLTPAFRRGLSRALEQLEDEGILRRVATGCGRKTTAVTPTARFVAEYLKTATPEQTARIRRTLNLTAWGQAILRELEVVG